MVEIRVRVPVDIQYLETVAYIDEVARGEAYRAARIMAGRPVENVKEVGRWPLFEGSSCMVIEFSCTPIREQL